LSFAAYLKLPRHQPEIEAISHRKFTIPKSTNPQQAVFTRNRPTDPSTSLVTSGHWASSHIQSLKRKSQSHES
ncbi:hypothetical protein, partial [Kaarinaea lacus]